MSMPDLYYRALIALPAEVPQPTKGGSAPKDLVSAVKVGLNLLAWAGTAAGVIGVLACGTVMAISHKRGEASEHMSRLGLVLAGCVLVAAAGPLVSWFFNGGSDTAATNQ
ncbi:hypothetical protein [Actinoplanes sp. NPDC051851]|uniref:hypothetical protein n=1 Tax=Actinoplanes sp. NPDC051851 TaxID=3154753 RepID=UPI003420EF85